MMTSYLLSSSVVRGKSEGGLVLQRQVRSASSSTTFTSMDLLLFSSGISRSSSDLEEAVIVAGRAVDEQHLDERVFHDVDGPLQPAIAAAGCLSRRILLGRLQFDDEGLVAFFLGLVLEREPGPFAVLVDLDVLAGQLDLLAVFSWTLRMTGRSCP